jgi:hypothetical protein
MGFKRCFVLAVITGVTGILGNNVFNKNATLESTTPVSGIIGYSFGYFLQKCRREWAYYINEKVNMILLLLFLCFLYVDLMVKYSNINVLSNAIALVFGFMFCFADPNENQAFNVKNIIVILLMSGILAIIVLVFFFHSSIGMIET